MWKVAQWDVATRKGELRGMHFDTVEFDERHTDVLDFEIGEEVNVVFEHGTMNLVEVTPYGARYRPRTDLPPTKAPDARRVKEARKVLSAVVDWDLEWEVASWSEGRLVLRGGDLPGAEHAYCELTFHGTDYVELPFAFRGCVMARIADPVECGHILNRSYGWDGGSSEVPAPFVIALCDIDVVYFVVCESISFNELRG